MKKIKLNRYKGKSPLFVLVSDIDFEKVNQYKWFINYLGYAVANIKDKRIYMHRFIMEAPRGKVIDHIDRNKLNNTRENLRICNIATNIQNSKLSKLSTSGHKGISWRKDRGYYRAYITVKRKQLSLGAFNNIEDAILARIQAEKIYFIKP